MLISERVEVTGSDDGVFPPVSDYLDSLGIAWRSGFDAAAVPGDIDVAVIGSSAKLDLATNPELAEIVRRGIPRFGFADYLGRHTEGRDNIVIAGSFGKSTLTALTAVMMREAGRDLRLFPSAQFPSTCRQRATPGLTRPLLIGGDGYVIGPSDRRPKFCAHDRLCAALISSIVHDHVNVYPTMADYEAAFAGLDRPPAARRALLVCANAYEPLHRLTRDRKVIWYGLRQCDGYWADRIEIGEATRFDLITPSGELIALRTGFWPAQYREHRRRRRLLIERGRRSTPRTIQAATARFRERRGDASTKKTRAIHASRSPTRASVHPTKRPVPPSRPYACIFRTDRPWWSSSNSPHLELA